MAIRIIQRDASTTERTYVSARVVLLTVFIVVTVISAMGSHLFVSWALLAGATFYLVATLLYFWLRSVGTDLTRALLLILPVDLLACALLLIATHEYEDPVYAVFLAIPIFYAFLLHRSDAWIVGVASAVVYVAAHLVADMPNIDLMLQFFTTAKALGIVFLGVISTMWAVRYRERQDQLTETTLEKQELNNRLQRRLGELQAVSQITEIVHSSLDFDRIGPLVLDIVSKVIDTQECCMFVIDRAKGETLFTASVGMPSPTVDLDDGLYGLTEGTQLPDSHFSCMSVFDHHSMMVVFCASSEVVDNIASEDRLVLQAVASELVVAIENSQLYKLTKRLAITDELTGLHNYRYLQQRLDEEVERAKRYRKDLSLLMFDVDDFKGFNDTQGHVAGDVALADFGEVLTSIVREVDVVARYGGEEFSVVLPETDAAGAFVVAEKIREAVSLYPFKDKEGVPGCSITCSIGLATYPSHAKGKETLLKLADDALYRAKHSGRNRVRSPETRRPVRLVEPEEHADGEERIS